MTTWLLFRARTLDLVRGWLWKTNASTGSVAGLNFVPLVLLGLYLLLTYLFPLLRVSPGTVQGRPLLLSDAMIGRVADIHVWAALGIGLFGGLIAFLQYFLEEESFSLGPITDAARTRSFLLVRLLEAIGVVVVLVFPGCVFLSRYTDQGALRSLGDLVSITGLTICSSVAAVSFAAAIRIVGRRTGGLLPRIVVTGAIIVATMLVGGVAGLPDAGSGSAGFANLDVLLESMSGLLSGLLSGRAGPGPWIGELVTWWAGLFIFSVLLLEAAVRLLRPDIADTQARSWSTASSRWRALPLGLLSPQLRPFVERDLILLSRHPLQAARQLLVVVVAFVGLPIIFPKADTSLAMLTVLQVPPLLCATLVLHSFGREGDFIHVIRLAASVESLYRARMATSIVAIPLLGLLVYLAMTPLFLAKMTTEVAMIGCGLVVLESGALVFWSLAVGTYFVDFKRKKLRPDYGVTIGGELAFWGGAGILSLDLFVLTEVYPDRPAATIAVCLALLIAMGVVSWRILVRGRSRLTIN